MKYQDAEKVMSKLEDAFAGDDINVTSYEPEEGGRAYRCSVGLGSNVENAPIIALSGIAQEVKAELRLEGSGGLKGIRATIG